MKASFLAENLKLALTLLKLSMPGRNNKLPVLDNVMVQTDEKRLLLVSTNLEVATKVWIGARIDEDGKTTLPFRELNAFSKANKKGQIDLSLADKTQITTLDTGMSSTTIAGIDADEYPIIPTIESEWKVALDAQELLNAIKAVKHAASKGDDRPVLNSVLLEFTHKGHRIAATDGFRLVIKPLRFTSTPTFITVKEGEDPQPVRIVVPLTAVEVLLKALPLARDTIALTWKTNGNQSVETSFTTDQWEIVVYTDYASYPQFDAIVPEHKDDDFTVVAEVKDLLSAAEKCLPVAKQSAYIVKIDGEVEDDLRLTAWSQNTTLTAHAKVKYTGQPHLFAVNCQYLVQALESMPRGLVTFRQADWTKPILFTYDDVTMVIMPMHLAEQDQPKSQALAEEDGEEKSYADMTEEELAEVKGRFSVDDGPDGEFDCLLDAINYCEGVANGKHCKSHVFDNDIKTMVWEVDGRR